MPAATADRAIVRSASSASPCEEPSGARRDDSRFEPARLGRRNLLAKGGQPEVAAPFVIFCERRPVRGFLDQVLGEHPAQGAVEVPRHDPAEAAALLNVADQAPPMPLAFDQGEQYFEHEWLQRKVIVDWNVARLCHHATTLV